MHEGRTGSLWKEISKIAQKHGMGGEEADDLGLEIAEMAVDGMGLSQKETDELERAIDERRGKPLGVRPREIYRLKREIINAVAGDRTNRTADEIKEEIISTVGLKPRMNQREIAEYIHKTKQVSLGTARKHLNELVGEGKILKEKRDGALVYFLKSVENEEDLTKALCQHLDNIVKAANEIKSKVPKMPFEVKQELGYSFSDMAVRFLDRLNEAEADHRRSKGSDYAQINDMWKETHSLIEESDIPAEDQRVLRDVVDKITARLRELNSYKSKCQERLRKARDEERKAIKREIGRIFNRNDEAYLDFTDITNALKHELKPIGETARKLAEKYTEEKSALDEIERLLDGLPRSYYAAELRGIVDAVLYKRSLCRHEKNELYDGMAEDNLDDKDWKLERIDKFEEQIKGFDADLDEIKEWLVSGKPLKDLVKRMNEK